MVLDPIPKSLPVHFPGSPPQPPTSHHACKMRVQTWMSQVTHVNESCRKYEWVMSLVWMSHGIHARGYAPVKEWKPCIFAARFSFWWTSYVCGCGIGDYMWNMTIHVHTYRWVMSHMWKRHVPHQYAGVVSRIQKIHTLCMKESCVQHDY